MENQLILGDSFEVLKSFPDNSVDAIITDPPYGLRFMSKKWDYQIPSVELWQEVLRVLKPGGHALVACGTRTQHRMAVNLEDSGFEIRDIISWLYGSGFPKSLNIGKAVNEKLGNEREVIASKGKFSFSESNCYAQDKWTKSQVGVERFETKGNTEYEGQGTALKPAQELFTLCRKPLSEKTIVDNVLKWGTGGLNIDDCRVGTEERINKGQPSYQGATGTFSGQGEIPTRSDKVVQGRFPANVIHDDSDEVVSQFPFTTSGEKPPIDKSSHGMNFLTFRKGNINHFPASSGSASRFFYCAKASPSERKSYNNHPTVKSIALMEYLIELITPVGGVVLDPFGGSGTTVIACLKTGRKYIVIEREPEYYEIAKKRIAEYETEQQLSLNLDVCS